MEAVFAERYFPQLARRLPLKNCCAHLLLQVLYTLIEAAQKTIKRRVPKGGSVGAGKG